MNSRKILILISISFVYSITNLFAKIDTVNLVGFIFVPDALTINIGDTVLWRNTTLDFHTTTSGTGCISDGIWDSGDMNPGDTFSFVFNSVGNFPYFCIPHCLFPQTGVIDVKVPKDAGVIAMSAPSSDCLKSANENVTVDIYNFGTDTIFGLDATYLINSSTPITETIGTAILPAGTLTYTFFATADLSVPDSIYAFFAWTALSGDTIGSNDTLMKNVEHFLDTISAKFGYVDSGLLTVSFFDSSTSAASWLWNFGDDSISTAQNPIHTYDSASTYTVCLTVTNSCGTDSICDSITVTSTGISENNLSQLIRVRIYPNTFNTFTTLLGPNKLKYLNASFYLYDVLGREVKRIENIKTNKVKIARDNLPDGLYIYELKNGEEIIGTGKLIIH